MVDAEVVVCMSGCVDMWGAEIGGREREREGGRDGRRWFPPRIARDHPFGSSECPRKSQFSTARVIDSSSFAFSNFECNQTNRCSRVVPFSPERRG